MAVWIALGTVMLALAVVLFVVNAKTMDDDQ